jgi:hypothetical protein
MADYKVNDVAWNVVNSVREANQAVAESAVAAYDRNVAYAQSTFENSIELLKSHADSSRTLLREQTEQQFDVQSLLSAVTSAQERNLHYAQTTLENGAELWRNQIQGARELGQKLAEQSHRQAGAVRHLFHESVNAYVDFLFTPFSYYNQALDTAESIARQGVDTAERIGRQGLEAAQRTTYQSAETARQTMDAAQQANPFNSENN